MRGVLPDVPQVAFVDVPAGLDEGELWWWREQAALAGLMVRAGRVTYSDVHMVEDDPWWETEYVR